MMPRKVLSWARFKIEAVFFRYTPDSTRNLQVHHRQARMVMVRRIRILQGLQTGPASSAETNSARLSVRIIGWPQVGLEEVGALSEWSATRKLVPNGVMGKGSGGSSPSNARAAGVEK
jgi:hypothetical protein